MSIENVVLEYSEFAQIQEYSWSALYATCRPTTSYGCRIVHGDLKNGRRNLGANPPFFLHRFAVLDGTSAVRIPPIISRESSLTNGQVTEYHLSGESFPILASFWRFDPSKENTMG